MFSKVFYVVKKSDYFIVLFHKRLFKKLKIQKGSRDHNKK